MAELSNYLENKLLDHILRGATPGTAFVQPNSVWLAMHTANPTDAGTGTEVNGGTYGRVQLTMSSAVNGSSSNTNAVTIAGMPTSNVSYIALWDAQTNGNMLFHTSISTQSFNSGDSATIAVGAITATLD